MDLQEAKRLHQQGDIAAAAAAYLAILEDEPRQFDALHLLGVLRLQQGRSDEAVHLLGLAHGEAPGNAACLNNYANALHAAGRHADAAALYARAVERMPESAPLRVNFASALAALGRHEEALVRCDEALALDASSSRALSLRGNALFALDRLDEALADYDRSIALERGNAEAHRHRGVALHALARDAEAEAALRRAIALRADDIEAHAKLAEVLLRGGRYAEGWRQYEWRWHLAAHAAAGRRLRAPRWDGSQDIAGRTVLLVSEQGLGDTLMAVRYVPLVAGRGAKVLLEVQPQLKSLLAGMAGASQVLAQGEALPAHDFQCPLFSLPPVFGEVPATVPYIVAPEAAAAPWRKRLQGTNGLRAAIVWSGNPAYAADRTRSMPPETIQPLLDVPGVAWFAPQRDVTDEAARVLERAGVARVGGQLGDFAEVAAFIANMDLVVTVDTSFGHIAGALGRPVWMMLAHSPHWPWMLEREDSAWYPTARIFRQPAPGDWGPAVARAEAGLRRLVR